MNYGMDRIAALDSCHREKFTRPVSRLIAARRKLHSSHHERPIQRDMFAEYDAIAAWGVVTSCYSGIEQAMKCLLQMREAFVEKSLCKACFERVQGKGNEECKNEEKCGFKKHYEGFFQGQSDFVHSLDDRRNHRHHFIGKLFHALALEEQEVLRVSYGIYRSLHDYIPPETVDSFLDAIDSGYPTWRYFLLEGEMPPTTHPGAMLEIWAALSDILQARVFTNHGLYSVEQRIMHNLRRNGLQEAWREHINTGIGQREIDDLNHWMQKSHKKVTINAYADLFYHRAESSLDLIEVLPSTREILKSVVGIAQDKWVDNDFSHFLNRAQLGDIVWNPDTNLFEKVARAEEIEIKLIEPEDSYVDDFILAPSVKVNRVESVPDYIEGFLFTPRVAARIVVEDWMREDEEGMVETSEYDGEIECEAYSCHINGTELVIVLYDSKEWIVYRYHNEDVPGVPYSCKYIDGETRSIREAIKAIEHWRETEKAEFEAYRNSMWNRRAKKRDGA